MRTSSFRLRVGRRSVGLLGVLVALLGACREPVPLSVDSTRRFQTWVGWEVVHNLYHRDENPLGELDRHPVPQPILDEMLDDAVGELGITALDFTNAILTLVRQRPGLEPTNDNDDPFSLDSDAIRWHWFDPYVRSILLPMKERVEARGERFVLTLSAVAWGAWHWREPASDPGQEYAEIIMACLDRLERKFGVVPDFVDPYNEPDHHSQSTESKDQILRGIRALTDRMRAAGHPALLRFPDVERLSAVVPFLDHMAENDPELLSRLGFVAFHGYGGFDAAELREARARARRLGIPTAQSEWWFTRNHAPDIHRTLTEADVSIYQPYVLSGPSNDPNDKGLYGIRYSGDTFPLYDFEGFFRKLDWYEIYQYSSFIRPGDVRIEISSPDPEVLPVAFEKPDGRQTVVVAHEGSRARRIAISGLAPGPYDVVTTSATLRAEPLASVVAEPGEPLVLRLPPQSVSSIQRRAE